MPKGKYKKDLAQNAEQPSARRWDDVTVGDLESALTAATRSYDPIAARNLIEYFHERITSGQPYEPRILHEYLDHAFGRIIRDNKSADVAFGLMLGKGEYDRPDTTERDVMATAYVVLAMRGGATWQDAIGDAANLLCDGDKGDRAIMDAYQFYSPSLWALPDQHLLDMLPPGTTVITRDMGV